MAGEGDVRLSAQALIFFGEKKVWTGLSVQMRSLAQLQPVSCVTDTQRQRILVAFYSRPEWLRGSK